MNKHAVGEPIVLPNGEQAPFSPAFKANGQLFISGQVAFESDGRLSDADIEQQTLLCLQAIERIAQSEGLFKTDLVKLTIWLTDTSDIVGFNKAYQAFFGEHRPARSTVRADLVVPKAKVEIEAIAVY